MPLGVVKPRQQDLGCRGAPGGTQDRRWQALAGPRASSLRLQGGEQEPSPHSSGLLRSLGDLDRCVMGVGRTRSRRPERQSPGDFGFVTHGALCLQGL